MIVKKSLITEIDIESTEDIYSTDLDATIKEILTKRYVNRCFKKSYIIEITEINDRGPLTVEYHRNGGRCRVAVNFSVRCIVYDKYEVIASAKIVQIMENGKFILESEHAAIGLAPNAALQPFKIGQTIPVRVIAARYVPYSQAIAVQGIPFVPVYLSEPAMPINISKDDIRSLEPIINKIREEDARAAALDKKTVAFYRDLYQLVNPAIAKMAGHETVDLVALEPVSGALYKPDEANAFSTKSFLKKERSDVSNINYVKACLNTVYKNLAMVNQLVEAYPEPKEHAAVWRLYEEKKKK